VPPPLLTTDGEPACLPFFSDAPPQMVWVATPKAAPPSLRTTDHSNHQLPSSEAPRLRGKGGSPSAAPHFPSPFLRASNRADWPATPSRAFQRSSSGSRTRPRAPWPPFEEATSPESGVAHSPPLSKPRTCAAVLLEGPSSQRASRGTGLPGPRGRAAHPEGSPPGLPGPRGRAEHPEGFPPGSPPITL